MAVRVLDVSFHVIDLRTRIPFKFGIATMTAAPQLYVGVTLDVDGARSLGLAADLLPPKWFTKDPNTTYRDDLADMLTVIRSAADIAKRTTATGVFELWLKLYAGQKAWAQGTAYPPLLWNLGVSLIERAVVDAYCRGEGKAFGAAVRDGSLGFQPSQVHCELRDVDAGKLLPEEPLSRVTVRHTVGLSDPITDMDIAAADRVNDRLPQSIEASIAAHGLTHFKIKLCGQADQDRARLEKIAAVLRRLPHYAFTLDGNENFKAMSPFRTLWDSLESDSALSDFLTRLLFVEQPFHRDVALSPDLGAELRGWENRPPIIIDESDAEWTSLPTALNHGYAGTSHKNCKGVFKGLANACLVAHRQREEPRRRLILSGEDLTNTGPVALLQDLAVMATMGIAHVERNGHHYFAGLSAYPAALQHAALAAHPDVYQKKDDRVTLRINRGSLHLSSALAAPFGYDFDLDPAIFTPIEKWSP